MKRVLIIGPNFHYFNESIERAFRSLGWDTKVEAYDTPIHPYSLWNKIRYKVAQDKLVLKQGSRKKYDTYIQQIADQYCPSLVFIMNGDNLLPRTMEYLSKRAKVAVWVFDSVRKYPLIKENLKYANAVFCYEQEDIPYLSKEYRINAHFLPQAFDPQLYYPIEGVEKKYDIAFAGDIWQSKKRQDTLQAVVNAFPEKRIIIWGIYKPWYKGIWKWLTRERKDIYKNKNTTAEVLNRTYNESRLVLNIHVEQQKNGANPKVYEIAASGAIQLCDANPYVETLGIPNMLFYHSPDELIQLIRVTLNNALVSKREDLNQHTFESRIKTVLQQLEQA